MTEPLVNIIAPKSFCVEYSKRAPMLDGIPNGTRLRMSISSTSANRRSRLRDTHDAFALKSTAR